MIINFTSYKINVGITSAPAPKKESTLYRTFIDGEISSINYGARVEHTALFEVKFLEKTEFYTLVDYLIANAGNKIEIKYESEDEQLWLDVDGFDNGDGTFSYFVYLLEETGLQEEAFTTKNSLYSLNIKASLAGITSTAVPNEEDTANIDVYIEVDTLGDNVTRAASEPGAPELNDKWFNTTNNELKKYDGTAFVLLYVVFADSLTDHAWIQGRFLYAAFATSSTTDHQAGFINNRAVKFPSQNINIEKGPAVSRKEGFTFSVGNNDAVSTAFAHFITENGINLFGAVCTLKIFNNSVLTQIVKGRNETNSFSYSSYKFSIVPFSLTSERNIPATTIEDVDGTRYDDVKQGVIGKAPFLTYGTHEMAMLQDITTEEKDLVVDRYLAPPNTQKFISTTVQGRIKFRDGIAIDSTTFISAGVVNYAIDGALDGSFDDAVPGDKILVSGCFNTNNNGASLTILSKVSNLIIQVANPNVNSSNDDESPSGTILWLSEKIFINKHLSGTQTTEPAGFFNYDNFTFTEEQLTKIDLATSVITINFDSQFATNTDNYEVVRKIISIDDAVVDSKFYILTLEDLLEFPSTQDPNVATELDLPFTRDYIQFAISSFAFQYQSGDVPHQSFGVYNNNETPDDNTDFTFFEDQIKIFTLDDKGKALIPIPNTKFVVNEDKNLVSLNPDAAAKSDTVSTEEPVLADTPIIFNGSAVPAQITTIKTQLGFDFTENDGLNSILTLPTVWNTGFYGNPYGINYSAHLVQSFTAIAAGAAGLYRNFTALSRNATKPPEINGNQITYKHTLVFNVEDGIIPDATQNGTSAIAFTLPISHANDSEFINSDEVKLALKFDFVSVVHGYRFGELVTTSTGANDSMTTSMPLIVHIRFKRKDGTYEYNPSASEGWRYDFRQENLGVTHNGSGTLGSGGFDNIPDPTDETKFAEGSDRASTNFQTNSIGSSRVLGLLNTDWHGLKFATTIGVDPFKVTDGSGATIKEGTAGDDDGYLFWDGLNDQVLISKDNEFEEAVVGLDFELTPKMKGRDLIDLASDALNLFGGSGKWESLEAMEIIIEPDFDNLNYEFEYGLNPGDDARAHPTSCQWDFNITFDNETPLLYKSATQDVTAQALFSAVKGKVIDGTFTENAKDITKDVLNTIYPDTFNQTSIDTYFEGSRANWKFRRQFTSAMTADAALKELLESLWAVAIINESDELELKPLDTSLISSSDALALTDSNVILDSVKEMKYRKSKDIYQFFKLGYDYYIPSETSNAFWEYGKQMTVSSDEGPIDLQVLINNTSTLYNLENHYNKNFRYHYETLPISEQVVKWKAFNSWSFKCQVAIETILSPNNVKLMDPITFTSYFFTKNATFNGFITSIKLNGYAGTATLGIYIPEPAGVLGPLCDPFNDALNVSDRDISGWTEANGQTNDAGKVSTRTLSGLTQKDAGQVSTRTFDC